MGGNFVITSNVYVDQTFTLTHNQLSELGAGALIVIDLLICMSSVKFYTVFQYKHFEVITDRRQNVQRAQ